MPQEARIGAAKYRCMAPFEVLSSAAEKPELDSESARYHSWKRSTRWPQYLLTGSEIPTAARSADRPPKNACHSKATLRRNRSACTKSTAERNLAWRKRLGTRPSPELSARRADHGARAPRTTPRPRQRGWASGGLSARDRILFLLGKRLARSFEHSGRRRPAGVFFEVLAS